MDRIKEETKYRQKLEDKSDLRVSNVIPNVLPFRYNGLREFVKRMMDSLKPSHVTSWQRISKIASYSSIDMSCSLRGGNIARERIGTTGDPTGDLKPTKVENLEGTRRESQEFIVANKIQLVKGFKSRKEQKVVITPTEYAGEIL